MRGVDNFSQGSELNVAAMLTDSAFTLSRVDVRDEMALDEVCDGASAMCTWPPTKSLATAMRSTR